ncbi:MAG: TlpA disulfide reductase family protein [Planctomycetota bacterium]
MIDFYEQHKSDRFEFIAFHDANAKSFAELDPHMEKLKAEHWHGRDLPFPILLDATGKTIRKFGVHAFPTQILIDPEGKLVGQGSLNGFRDLLLGKKDHPPQGSSKR